MKEQEWEKGPMKPRGRHITQAIIVILALFVLLLMAFPVIPLAQEAPAPPTPPAAPVPPEPPQVFVLNDGSAHLGVSLSDVTPERAKELKLPSVAGAIVQSVQKDSAAAKAGFEENDVILEFDGVRVRSSAELRRLIRETPVGRTVAIKIMRDGATRMLDAQLEASGNSFSFNMPEIRVPRMEEIPPSYGPHRVTLGISGDDLTPQLAQFFGVKQGKGVLVTEIVKGGAAEKAGLKAGDVIVQINSKPIGSVEELRFTLNLFLDDPRKVDITIVRDHHEQTVHADLSRFKVWKEQTTSARTPADAQALAEIQAQAEQLRALANAQVDQDQVREQADQLRTLAERQRAIIEAEVQRQQECLKAEWQRQVQEQAKALKEQMQKVQTLHLQVQPNNEI
jgi:membrane-associated protease RseP (regulator of RpoE activity)